MLVESGTAPSRGGPRNIALPQLGGIVHWLRTVRMGFWLGWQIESNWTDPFQFFIYSIARPLGGALILVFMYFVVAQADRGPFVWYFLVGSAFWPYVVNGMQGMAAGVISDREHWRTLKYVYTSPIPYDAYLIGRSLSQMAAASAATLVTLGMGAYFLGLPLSHIHWGLTLAGLALGLVGIVCSGLILVTAALSISGDAWRMPEGVGAALYLVCGVIFPVTVLPEPVQWLSRALPLTWWLDVMRRGVLGPEATGTLGGVTDLQALGILGALTAAFVLVAAATFGFGLRRARQAGILDRESAY